MGSPATAGDDHSPVVSVADDATYTSCPSRVARCRCPSSPA
jgi:hypothetical protein